MRTRLNQIFVVTTYDPALEEKNSRRVEISVFNYDSSLGENFS